MTLYDRITLYGVTYPAGSGDATNRYGDPVRVEADGVTVPAQVRPQGRGMDKEELTGEDRRISFFHVIVGPDTVLDGLSRIEWQGRRFELQGEPQPIVWRRGLRHYEFTMRSVLGG